MEAPEQTSVETQTSQTVPEQSSPINLVPPPPLSVKSDSDKTDNTKSDNTKSDTQSDTQSDTHSDTHSDKECPDYPECPPPDKKPKSVQTFVPISVEVSPVIELYVDKPKICLRNKADGEPCFFFSKEHDKE